MVKINLNIKKKDLWLLSAIMVFLIGVGYVVAIGSGDYQVQGHDFSELQKCAANLVLKADASGNWQCSSDAKCDTSGACTQVCIGSDCRAIWPAAVQATTCPAGRYVNSTSSIGVVTCSTPYVAVSNCVYPPSGNTWLIGQSCCWGGTGYRWYCGVAGWRTILGSCGSALPC